MNWFLAIAIVGYGVFKFYKIWKKDNDNLSNILVTDKFKIVGEVLNSYLFNGEGEVKYNPTNKISFHIYKNDSPKIVMFTYSNSTLVIELRYKYLIGKELVVKEFYRNIEEIGDLEQKRIAEDMIRITESKIEELRNKKY